MSFPLSCFDSYWRRLASCKVSFSLYGTIFSLFLRQSGDGPVRFCTPSNRSYQSFSDKSVRSSGSGCSAVSKGQQVRTDKLVQVQQSRKFFTKFLTKTKTMALAPKVKLNNGLEMPVLGLGTYLAKDNEGEIAVKHAIDCGYRHFDTAYFYQNEAQVGKAIKDKIAEGVITREDVFIVTKLWNIHHAKDKVEYACRKSLNNLGLDYIDLYLMHIPVAYKFIDDDTLLPKDKNGKLILDDIDYLETYKAMEELVKLGLVKSIGVSNFNSKQIERILKNCVIKPVTNQVECSPALNQKKLINFCKERDITLTAYSPLSRPNPGEKTPDFIYSDKTKAIAEKYNKTPAQIVLRYLVDIGTIPIPKSSNKNRIEENFNIFDFKLSEEDIAAMDCFNTGERLVPFLLIKEQNHKYFPFNIEY